MNRITEALEEYLERHPEQGNIEICSGDTCVKMSDISDEIMNETKIGLSYQKSILKMSIADFCKEAQKQTVIFDLIPSNEGTQVLAFSNDDINVILRNQQGNRKGQKRENKKYKITIEEV